jgi:ABC-type multidrug transport system ATPase subunit
MIIEFQEVSKRYRFEWIIKNMSYRFNNTNSYAIIGNNGSGKSTLMQMISGYLSPSSGRLTFSNNDIILDVNDIYKEISFVAPYIELVEEFTLTEAINFHKRFKPFSKEIEEINPLDFLQLPKTALNKPIQYFSSGMKQRLKLGLSFMSQSAVLLLDEPTITLDREGISWYREMLEKYAFNQRLLIIASNVMEDIEGCSKRLEMKDLKA